MEWVLKYAYAAGILATALWIVSIVRLIGG